MFRYIVWKKRERESAFFYDRLDRTKGRVIGDNKRETTPMC